MPNVDVQIMRPDGKAENWSVRFISTREGEPSDGMEDAPSDELDAFFGIGQGQFKLVQGMMAHDIGVNFIAIVNDVVGMIFEAECLTKEVDGGNKDYADLNLLDRAVLNAKNQQALVALAEQYPEALFGITPEGTMWDNRAGAWAFVPHDKLVQGRVIELANAICEIGSPS